jgi:hypothetical protein
MDWIFKAALTAAMVFVVVTAARHLGQRAAGVMAALPIITAPTLAWVAHEQGVGFAVSAAVGSVAACAIMAAFSLGYARGARLGGVATALTCGLAGALAIAVPAATVSARLGAALALALVCCSVALVSVPVRARLAAPVRQSRLAPVAVALVSGGLSALAATIGPDLGGFATGLLSSLPLIGGGVAILEHATSGPSAAERFLHGYVRGLFGKTAFGVVFALLAAQVGTPSALILAIVTACMFSHSWRRPLPAKPPLQQRNYRRLPTGD